MNKKFVNHFQYSWWVYIVIAFAFIFLWSSVFEALAKPESNERLNVSFIGTGFDHKKLETDLCNSVFKDTKIEEVFVESVVADEGLNNILYVRSQGEYDVIIIQETVVFSGMCKSYFEPLDKALMTQYFGDITFYEEDGQAYGILLDGPGFADYYSGEESCYLFVAPVSQNFAGIYGGNEDDDAVIRLIQYLLGGDR